ncbi:cell wall-associated NlpC family hydrolase [Arthrobacter pigmenti]|uniref:Cell wall-associated NlpC family hydrolase n=1 Tax=Arthrobacter pigmenti TaxID=271432 RepID=A0A846RHP3_9MICC|nr:C40 family peptidase [Arthrobacter pigmenti]NJC21220.1 cell wall-associated NlpC family hydrolase [Arthrobacter pigmenti]
MTLTDTVGRVQQIQSTLTQLTTPVRSGNSGAAFAEALAAQAATASPRASAAPVTGLAEILNGTGAGLGSASGLPAAPGLGAAPDLAGAIAALVPDASESPGAGAQKLIDAAMKYEGLPYVWGGTDPAVGLDCSGFVQRAFRDIGIELPRVTWDQMKEGTAVASMADARPGDLLFSFDGGHVSIYLGNGKAIDAPQPGDTIAVRDAWETDANVTAIRRILPADDAAALAAAAQAALVTGGTP